MGYSIAADSEENNLRIEVEALSDDCEALLACLLAAVLQRHPVRQLLLESPPTAGKATFNGVLRLGLVVASERLFMP
jgi:hypothetical protein